MMKIAGTLLICLLLSELGCGIKGPPLPPLKEETIQGQKNWDAIEKATQPTPVIPKPKKKLTKKKPNPDEN